MFKKVYLKLFVLMCLIFASLCMGCKNFLQGGQFYDEITDAIEYANTPEVLLKVSASNLYGTLTAETGGTYKLKTVHKISMDVNPVYQFVRWMVLDSENHEADCTENDAVYIADKTNPSTTFSILKEVSGYKIQAVCELRPAVTVHSPDSQKAVNRDRTIVISFNQPVDEENFRFTSEEQQILVKKGCELLKDHEDKVYGYVKDGAVYFKNIEIYNYNDRQENLLQCFYAPVVNGQVVTIEPYTDFYSRFELDEDGYKDVFVTVSNKVNNSGIKMFQNYSFTYRAGNSTDAQTKISVSVPSYMGIVNTSGGTYSADGKPVSIIYTESDNYKFIGWTIEEYSETDSIAVTNTAYDEKNGIAQADVLVLKGEGNVSITPEVAKRPAVSIMPAYIASGSDFDTEISVVFDIPVCKENFVYSQSEIASFGSMAVPVYKDNVNKIGDVIAVDLGKERFFKNVNITDVDGKNINNYYKAMIFAEDGKSVKYIYDSEKLFNFGLYSTKDIYVSVSNSIFAEYKDSEGKIYQVRINDKKDYSDFNFRVKNSSAEKAKVNISAMDTSLATPVAMGSLNISGNQEFSIGQKITINFIPSADYEFIKWSVTGDVAGNLLIEGDETNRSLTFTVLGGVDGIEIKPFCESIKTSRIRFSTNSGTVSPSGYVNVRRKETVDLICKVTEKNCFARWKVINILSGDELPAEKYEKYFKFNDIYSPETSVTLLYDCSNLAVEADTYLRPVIYDHDPVNTISGTNYDQSIRIFVNPGISESSLYYNFTTEEINQLKADGYTLLDAGNEAKHLYYGYYKKGDSGSYVFKNVKITNRANPDENLLQYYGAPSLQDEKGQIIVIPVNRALKLPAGKEILVSLGTEWGYLTEDGKTVIGLCENNLLFTYKTNGNKDETIPSLVSAKISGRGYDGTVKELTQFTSAKSLPAPGTFDYEEYKDYLVKPEDDGTILLDFDIKVEDEGLNLQSLTMIIKQYRDFSYAEPGLKSTYTLTLPLSVNSTEGECTKKQYKLSDTLISDLSRDGLYKVWFIIRDLSGNTLSTENTNYYYLLVDRCAPRLISDDDYVSVVKNGYVKVSGISRAKEIDATKTYVQIGNKPEVEVTDDAFEVYADDFEKNEASGFKLRTVDAFGNEKVYDSSYSKNFDINAGAKTGMIMYTNGYFSFKDISDWTKCGLVVESDYSGDKNIVYVAGFKDTTAKISEFEGKNLPDPEIVYGMSIPAVFRGLEYSVPSVAQWSVIDGNHHIFSAAGNDYYDSDKFKVDWWIYEAPFFFVKDTNLMFNGSEWYHSINYSGGQDFYYGNRDVKNDNTYNVKYVFEYKDIAE